MAFGTVADKPKTLSPVSSASNEKKPASPAVSTSEKTSSNPAVRTLSGASLYEPPRGATSPSGTTAAKGTEPAAPGETIAQKRQRLAPQLSALKSTLAPPIPTLTAPPRNPVGDLQRINATLSSVPSARDRSFLISELSDSELRALGSYRGQSPYVASGNQAEAKQVAQQYQTLFSTIGSSADGYQATRVLKQLPADRQGNFVEAFARNASDPYRKEFASTVAGDPQLDAGSKRIALQRTFLAATPAGRDRIAADPKVQALAKQSGATADNLLRGDGVGQRALGLDPEALADDVLLAGDKTVGTSHLDTAFEKKLVQKWLYGDGSAYVLSKPEMDAVKTNPSVVDLSKKLAATYGPHQAGDTGTFKLQDGTTARVSWVKLADGTLGARADMNFLAQKSDLDGSIGKGRVYFDGSGKPVGILDTYDFSNKNIFVDATNVVGRGADAKNYLVTGGLIEKDASFAVPPGP